MCAACWQRRLKFLAMTRPHPQLTPGTRRRRQMTGRSISHAPISPSTRPAAAPRRPSSRPSSQEMAESGTVRVTAKEVARLIGQVGRRLGGYGRVGVAGRSVATPSARARPPARARAPLGVSTDGVSHAPLHPLRPHPSPSGLPTALCGQPAELRPGHPGVLLVGARCHAGARAWPRDS
jgi:hypothetical protein